MSLCRFVPQMPATDWTGPGAKQELVGQARSPIGLPELNLEVVNIDRGLPDVDEQEAGVEAGQQTGCLKWASSPVGQGPTRNFFLQVTSSC